MTNPPYIPRPLHADSPVTMRPENRAVWSPYWQVMAVNLACRATGPVQSLILCSRRIGVYRDDPEFPQALADADHIAARLLEDPRRVRVDACMRRGREACRRRLFGAQWRVRYEGAWRTPLERYRQGDDPYDVDSDLIADD